MKLAFVRPNKLKCDNFANYKLVGIQLYLRRKNRGVRMHSQSKATGEKKHKMMEMTTESNEHNNLTTTTKYSLK